MGFRFPKTWSSVWQNRPIRKFCSIKSTRPGPAIKQARAGGLGGLGFSPPSYAARARGEEDRAVAASPDPRSEPWRDQSATMSSQHQHRRRGEDKQVAALPPWQLIMVDKYIWIWRLHTKIINSGDFGYQIQVIINTGEFSCQILIINGNVELYKIINDYGNYITKWKNL
jgi:hypothetical protein